MSLVILVSGGLDSSLVTALALENGTPVMPLFIDYGQLASEAEWIAARRMMQRLNAPEPERLDLTGYGQLIPSGLTRRALRRNEDAFLPGRNLVFLVMAASFAVARGAGAIAIGLLDENAHLFPDQTRAFIASAETAITEALGQPIKVLAPLISVSKAQVIALMSERGLTDSTYSCHDGGRVPCGTCISCLEISGAGGL
jgi:7-cyano-7-deazaguanine synthase